MSLSHPYPAPLETWWRERARRMLNLSSAQDCLQLLEPDVQHLSDLFTTRRSAGFGGYDEDPRALAAYGLFFFPQTFTRVRFPLVELLEYRGWKPPTHRPLRIMDLGTGTGSALFGAVRLLQDLPGISELEATAVDQSAESLRIARAIARDLFELWPRTTWDMHKGDLAQPGTWPASPRQWDLIMLSFSFNEAFLEQSTERQEQWLEALAHRLTPGGVLLLIEPALRETSERLELLRDGVMQGEEWTILGPCLHHRPCPLLRSGSFWCHEVRRWKPPESLVSINRKLYRSIETLKFSYLALKHGSPGQRERAEGDAGHLRLIAPMTEVKGKFITSGCAADGNRYGYELQTRGLSKSQKKEWKRIERGDILDISALTPLGSGETLRLTGLNALRRHYQPAHAREEATPLVEADTDEAASPE